jgi:hypothetical protein
MSAVFEARKQAALTALKGCCRRPLSAIEIAAACGIVDMHYWVRQSHETKRRRVRELIAELRDEGWRIVAGVRREETGDRRQEREASTDPLFHPPAELGYWLARDDAEWHDYLESRKANARFEFAMVRDMGTAARERNTEQGTLFDGARQTAWAEV